MRRIKINVCHVVKENICEYLKYFNLDDGRVLRLCPIHCKIRKIIIEVQYRGCPLQANECFSRRVGELKCNRWLRCSVVSTHRHKLSFHSRHYIRESNYTIHPKNLIFPKKFLKNVFFFFFFIEFRYSVGDKKNREKKTFNWLRIAI